MQSQSNRDTEDFRGIGDGTLYSKIVLWVVRLIILSVFQKMFSKLLWPTTFATGRMSTNWWMLYRNGFQPASGH